MVSTFHEHLARFKSDKTSLKRQYQPQSEVIETVYVLSPIHEHVPPNLLDVLLERYAKWSVVVESGQSPVDL